MRPNTLLEHIIKIIKKCIPRNLLKSLLPYYHKTLAFLSAVLYRFPSQEINIVAVTGTKGKTTTTEIINSILEEAGYTTALLNTYQFKIGENTERNLFKMSTPGRGFVQKFIRQAVDARCDWVVLELTSQAVLTDRHKYIHINSLIFTNISPEHIEAHGSFENYLNAKLEIAQLLKKSQKKNRTIVANIDDPHGNDFIQNSGVKPLPFSLKDVEPHIARDDGSMFTYKGKRISSHLPGVFNIYNMLGATVFAEHEGIPLDTIQKGIEKINTIRGRLECVNPNDDFEVYVDYAHTVDSLEKVYLTFPNRHIIAILGNTGGGRDTWKRPAMAKIAEKYCDYIIFANEDPYDEDPLSIVETMYEAVENKGKVEILLDRRKAIRKAIQLAARISKDKKPVVLITGKGTDPYIMGPNGERTPWDDAEVVREELTSLKEKGEL